MDPDPTPFFIDFKDAKKIFFYIFFITCPQFYFQTLFQSAQHIYEKKVRIRSRIRPGSGGSKTCGSGSRSGSTTLIKPLLLGRKTEFNYEINIQA
jgi:hypothetical protein